MPRRIAFLTAGGIAPCLSSSIGALVERYNAIAPDAEFIGYLNGYQGLLLGRSVTFPESLRQNHTALYRFGGSVIGNSRVKLTNIGDCVRRGLVREGQIPLQVAAERLREDRIDILHTIGGDDTNTTAAELAEYLVHNGYGLTVVGLPKTVDNDVAPIRQTLGAWTAAEQGSIFFRNIANENTTSSRQLIIHEIMGRHCGWLAAATALDYHRSLEAMPWFPELFLDRDRWGIDAIFLPEMDMDFMAECERLRERMDRSDKVHVFLSEGAGIDVIVRQYEASGKTVPRDAFDHPKIDELNPGKWFAEQLEKHIHANKVLVQKSGYFARSAAPNERDLELIKQSASAAADYALDGRSGVAGLDETAGNAMSCIAFPRIKGGKPFDIDEPWFGELLASIGQPKGPKVTPEGT